jgi:RNA polymerase primary sigma factor
MNNQTYHLDKNDDLLNSYLKDIAKLKVLNSDEVAILIPKAQSGNIKAREQIINGNLRFVVTIAKKFQNRGVPLMDLISAGNEGLCVSVDKFDASKGTTFLTYAGWWIKQKIYNLIYSTANEIRLPVTQRLLVIRILDATTDFTQKYSRTPTSEELEELTGIPSEQINYLAQFSNTLLSVDDYIGDEEGNQLCDVIPDNEPLLDDQLNKKYILNNLEKMLDILPDREHDLIRMMFGIGMDPVDPNIICNMYGVGKERIRQMKESALRKLRKRFSNQLINLI